MLAKGYLPLAVHTPWSSYAHSSGKQPVGKGWQINGHDQERLKRTTFLTANTGMLIGPGMVVIDIDTEYAEAVCQLCFARQPELVSALWRGRDGSARIACLCRLAEPITGKPLAEGEHGRLELLTGAKNFMVDGWHPSDRTGGTRWWWEDGRSPWTVLANLLPVLPAAAAIALINAIWRSDILGAQIQRYPTAQKGGGAGRPGKLPATEQLRELLRRHGGLVIPAVSDLVRQIGCEGAGRHDALIAIVGRLVHQRWTGDQIATCLVPLANECFPTADERRAGDVDWSGEIERAVVHAQGRDRAQLAKLPCMEWPA